MTNPFDNEEDRERVRGKIEALIKTFCHVGRVFNMIELTCHVSECTPIAPDSAGRIMRLLRQKGEINYKVVSRSESKYEVIPNPAKNPDSRQVALAPTCATPGPFKSDLFNFDHRDY